MNFCKKAATLGNVEDSELLVTTILATSVSLGIEKEIFKFPLPPFKTKDHEFVSIAFSKR